MDRRGLDTWSPMRWAVAILFANQWLLPLYMLNRSRIRKSAAGVDWPQLRAAMEGKQEPFAMPIPTDLVLSRA